MIQPFENDLQNTARDNDLVGIALERDVGTEIKKTLQALGMTEQGLAADIGVAPTTINRLLARTPKSIVILQKIRQHLEEKTGENFR